MLDLFYYIPLLLLAGRAAISSDETWKRWGAAALACWGLFAPILFGSGTGPNRYGSEISLVAIVLCGLYLLLWTFLTRDRLWQRIVSFVVGLATLLPVALFFVAMANYRE